MTYPVWFHHLYMAGLKLAARYLPITKPTMFIGHGAVSQLCHSVGLMGCRRVLVVTDSGMVELGFAAQLQTKLESYGVDSTLFADVVPDPTYTEAQRGHMRYQQQQCDAVVALGGGSPMDCAKVIAALATNKRSVKQLSGLLKVRQPPAPLFVIPTTAGTGSEVTVAAVVSNPLSHQKTPLMDPKLMPLVAALDPDLMMGLPAHITAQTGIDALTHAIEAYLSRNATPETDRHALAAFRLITDNLESAVKVGSNRAVRLNMSLAAYYAGLAFTKASLGYVHAIAHTLGSQYQIPHGLANALALPHVMQFSKSHAAAKMKALAVAGGVASEQSTPESAAQALIDYIHQLCAAIGLPHYLEEIQEEDIAAMVAQALKEAYWNYPVPKLMSPKDCQSIFRLLMRQ